MPRPIQLPDTISLRNLTTTLIVGPDAWCRPSKPQPLVLSFFLTLDIQNAAASDDIDGTFSYGVMCKDVIGRMENTSFASVSHLVIDLARMAEKWPGDTLRIEALLPKALLRSEGGLVLNLEVTRWGSNGARGQGEWELRTKTWEARKLMVACIIGVNPHERDQKQTVMIDLKVRHIYWPDANNMTPKVTQEDQQKGPAPIDVEDDVIKNADTLWQRMVQHVCKVVEPSTFQTLEALALLVARTCLEEEAKIPNVTVSVEKPSALAMVDGAGVNITRDRRWLHSQQQQS